MESAQSSTGEHRDIRGRRGFIITGLTAGHGVFHWFTQSFLVMLPEVQATFNLSEVGIGAIATTREVVAGMISLPGGVVVDMVRRHWGLVLAVCMGGFGLGWLVMGLSPNYFVLLVGMAIVAGVATIWHLPAMASLSHHFSHRRGTALSIHGIGGSIGDISGPVVTGVLLGVLSWRGILSIYAVLPLFLAFLVFWAFKNIGKTAETEQAKPDIRAQIDLTRHLLKNPVLWGITIVAGLRGMSFVAFLTFMPLYLDNELEMGSFARGLHVGLLVATGVAFTPVMGYLSGCL